MIHEQLQVKDQQSCKPVSYTLLNMIKQKVKSFGNVVIFELLFT